MEKRDFFISYTQDDLEQAEFVGNILKSHGYTVWLQKWDSPSGESFIGWMNRALSSCRNFIAIWSEPYEKSDWCREEREAAYEAKVHGKIEKFLPVRVTEHPMGPSDTLFRRYGRVDIFGVDRGEQERRILDAVGYQKREEREQQNANKSSLPAGTPLSPQSSDRWTLNGSPPSQVLLSHLNKEGNRHFHLGTEEGYQNAARLYQQAAAWEEPCAMKNLGYLYATGLGIERDYEKAREWFEKAAEKGNADALYNLGVLYDYGWGVQKNGMTAFQYYARGGQIGTHPRRLRK